MNEKKLINLWLVESWIRKQCQPILQVKLRKIFRKVMPEKYILEIIRHLEEKCVIERIRILKKQNLIIIKGRKWRNIIKNKAVRGWEYIPETE